MHSLMHRHKTNYAVSCIFRASQLIKQNCTDSKYHVFLSSLSRVQWWTDKEQWHNNNQWRTECHHLNKFVKVAKFPHPTSQYLHLLHDCNAFYRHVNNKRLHSLNVLLVYTLQKKTQRHNFSQNLCTKCLKWKKKKSIPWEETSFTLLIFWVRALLVFLLILVEETEGLGNRSRSILLQTRTPFTYDVINNH